MNLTVRILIGMAAGVLVGLAIQGFTSDDHWIQMVLVQDVFDAGGKVFIASLRLMVVPLVLVSLVCGSSSLADGASMGRLGGKSIGLYLFTTAVAISLALGLALFISPGEGGSASQAVEYTPRPSPGMKETFLNIFPTNPIQAMADGKMLQIIVFALLLGTALGRSGDAGQRIRSLFEDLNGVLMRLIVMLISLAPFGVFFLMAKLFSEVGWRDIIELGKYFATVILALVIHASFVYPALLLWLAKTNPLKFYRKMREPMLFAFSTSSSGATLPVTLRTVEKKLGVDNSIASFSVPLGATINMDGTAIMQGVATVFIAQYFHVDLVFTDYLMVILTATMASVGTAAVPGVGLIMLTMVLTQVGLPVEGIALIIGVDRLLDMTRTAVNVAGDAMVATAVAHSEKKLDRSVLDDPDAGRANP
ncbi:MAG TPA: dicarboxylate/amino acid:cation symporter [Gammaproteobacteria bacterium]|uniref:Amino acid transporter n=1 Tax=marine metagenome TaxID=408172 RepID=A0A381R0Y2_9ZZZZ|nr:dicarboxylate/amino acid:cation symporter [Gammaproteobacteria bacterium]HBP14684.1 dicarboxylate/amino acid:cation symporter [Gammaproteobacteria bacterium]HCP49545.1 dicarboxylate/amino acid:cation symporter [Gammaproteobacteria bacterium]|tara:strand:- start:2119 stop:3378 length:1260 start_codon:yes stop_codon:yes gene_type:complete